jgi:hypothetical protein
MKIKNFKQFSFELNERMGSNKSVEKLTAYFNYKIMNEIKTPSNGQKQEIVPGIIGDGDLTLLKRSTHEMHWTKEELKNDSVLTRFGLYDDEIFNSIKEWLFVFNFIVNKTLKPNIPNASLQTPMNNGKIVDNVVIIVFNIEIDTDSRFGKGEFRDRVKSILNHELHHVLQRNVSRTTPIMMSKSHSLNVLTNILKENESVAPILQEFLYIVYLHLDNEVDARIAHLYTEAKTKRFKNREQFENWLKKSDHKQMYDSMNDFDGDSLYQEILEFAKSQGAEQKDVDNYLKSFIRQFRDAKSHPQELKDVYTVNKNLPANPIGFFNHFENRFKETAKKYWSRCLRVWARLEENRK